MICVTGKGIGVEGEEERMGRNFSFRDLRERPSVLTPGFLLLERKSWEVRFPGGMNPSKGALVRPWRHRKPHRELPGQGVRRPGKALQNLAHDGRCAPEGIGNLQGPRIPGPEPGGFAEGPLAKIEKKILVRPVHEEDQVGPFGQERAYGTGAVAGEVEAEGPGLPHKVRRGGEVLLVGEAAGGDLETPQGEPAFQEKLRRRAPAEVAVADHQDPGVVREGQETRAGAEALLRASLEESPDAGEKAA